MAHSTNTQAVSEAELIQRCQRHERNAQQELYRKYEARMFQTCFRYVQAQQEAEDILVQGFLKVFQSIGDFESRGAGALESWIRTIMIRQALMHLRKRKFELVSDDEAVPLPGPATADGELHAKDIYALVRALPLGYRTVFNLFAIEGFSHAEIADSLGISVGASKSQLSKARAMLQKMLIQKGMYDEPQDRRPV